jgi:hypothetical protein
MILAANSALPSSIDKIALINKCKAQGLTIGTKVIRVRHITEFMLTQTHLVGTVHQFTLTMVPGYTEYRPIIVRFELGATNYSDMPFNPEELETLENAHKQVAFKKAQDAKLEERVISDIMQQSSGVIPFRLPQRYN